MMMQLKELKHLKIRPNDDAVKKVLKKLKLKKYSKNFFKV